MLKYMFNVLKISKDPVLINKIKDLKRKYKKENQDEKIIIINGPNLNMLGKKRTKNLWK